MKKGIVLSIGSFALAATVMTSNVAFASSNNGIPQQLKNVEKVLNSLQTTVANDFSNLHTATNSNTKDITALKSQVSQQANLISSLNSKITSQNEKIEKLKKQIEEPVFPSIFIPAYENLGNTINPLFNTKGNTNFYPNEGLESRLEPLEGGSVNISLTVPSNTTQTIAYGIPASGYLNDGPVEVLINGTVVDNITKDIGSSGTTTSKNLLLWKKTLDTGTYNIQFIGVNNGINFYGLWFSNNPVR